MMQEENNKYIYSHSSNHARIKRMASPIETTTEAKRHHVRTKTQPKVELNTVVQSPSPEKNVNRILENQKKRSENVTTRAVTDIKSQETTLQERLANRKQKLLNITSDSFYSTTSTKEVTQSLPQSPMNSSSTNGFFFEFECDKSAGSNSSIQLQQEIEKIMEDSFHEKSEKITEIKVKYEVQINELENEGTIYAEIIKEMRRQMEREIIEVSALLDLQRKQKINSIKSEFII